MYREFSEVLEKRRTYRDYSDREVSDEILNKVISAAFKAPTNDHLRQFEFVVVRGKENIAKVIAPLAKNMAAFKDLVFEVDDTGDKDKMAMFADALPKQQRMLMQSGLLIIPFYNQKQSPLLHPVEQKFNAESYLNMPRHPITLGQKMYGYAMPRQFTML